MLYTLPQHHTCMKRYVCCIIPRRVTHYNHVWSKREWEETEREREREREREGEKEKNSFHILFEFTRFKF